MLGAPARAVAWAQPVETAVEAAAEAAANSAAESESEVLSEMLSETGSDTMGSLDGTLPLRPITTSAGGTVDRLSLAYDRLQRRSRYTELLSASEEGPRLCVSEPPSHSAGALPPQSSEAAAEPAPRPGLSPQSSVWLPEGASGPPPAEVVALLAEHFAAAAKNRVDLRWNTAKLVRKKGGIHIRCRPVSPSSPTQWWRLEFSIRGVNSAQQVNDAFAPEHRVTWDPTIAGDRYLARWLAVGDTQYAMTAQYTKPEAGGLISGRAFETVGATSVSYSADSPYTILSVGFSGAELPAHLVDSVGGAPRFAEWRALAAAKKLVFARTLCGNSTAYTERLQPNGALLVDVSMVVGTELGGNQLLTSVANQATAQVLANMATSLARYFPCASIVD